MPHVVAFGGACASPSAEPDAGAPPPPLPLPPVSPCGAAGVLLAVPDLAAWRALMAASVGLLSSLLTSSGAQTWQPLAAGGLWTPGACAALASAVALGDARLQRGACRLLHSAALPSLGPRLVPWRAVLDTLAAVLGAATSPGLEGATSEDALAVAFEDCYRHAPPHALAAAAPALADAAPAAMVATRSAALRSAVARCMARCMAEGAAEASPFGVALLRAATSAPAQARPAMARCLRAALDAAGATQRRESTAPPQSARRKRLRLRASAEGADAGVEAPFDALEAAVLAAMSASAFRTTASSSSSVDHSAPPPPPPEAALAMLAVLGGALAQAAGCRSATAVGAALSGWAAALSSQAGPPAPPRHLRALADAVLAFAGAAEDTELEAPPPPPAPQLPLSLPPAFLVACARCSDVDSNAAAGAELRARSVALALVAAGRCGGVAASPEVAEAVVSVLRRCVRDDHPAVRTAAAAAVPGALAALGAQHRFRLADAASLLTSLSSDGDAAVLVAAAQAVGGAAAASAAVALGGAPAALAAEAAARHCGARLALLAAAGPMLEPGAFAALEASARDCVTQGPAGAGALSLSAWAPLLSPLLALPPWAPEEAAAAATLSLRAVLRHSAQPHLGGAAGTALLAALAAAHAHPARCVRLAVASAAAELASPAALSALHPGLSREEAERSLLARFQAASAVPAAGAGGTPAPPTAEAREASLRAFTVAGGALGTRSADTVTLFRLVGALDEPAWPCRAAALHGLHALAAARGLAPKALVTAHRPVLAYAGETLPQRPRLLPQLAAALGVAAPTLLRTDVLPAALSKIAAAADAETLAAVAVATGSSSPGTLLWDYAQFIIAELIDASEQRGATSSEGAEADRRLESAIGFLHQHTGANLADLVAHCRDSLVEALVNAAGAEEWSFGYDDGSADEESGIEAAGARLARVLCNLAGSQPTPRADAAATHDVAASFLLPHVTGALKILGDVLNSQAVRDGAAGKQALRSLRVLVPLLRGAAPRYAPKALALLARAAEAAPLRASALAGARGLVRALAAHAPQALPAAAGPLFVMCLPHLEAGGAHCAASAAVIDELVLRTGSALQGTLRALPPLPPLPQLQRAQAAVAAEGGMGTLARRLRALAEGLANESLAVRAAVAAEAARLLRQHRGVVAAALAAGAGAGFSTLLVNQPDVPDLSAAAASLVAALLQCCGASGDARARAATGRVHAAALDALQELGALDPSRVALPPAPAPRAFLSVRALGVALVEKHLVRLLRGAADPETLDAAAHAAQELLKAYACTPETAAAALAAAPAAAAVAFGAPRAGGGRSSGGRGAAAAAAAAAAASAATAADRATHPADAELWAALSAPTRELLAPCLSSKYVLTHGVGPPAVPPGVAIFNHRDPPFLRWLQHWSRALIHSAAASPRAAAFHACSGALRADAPLALFLLPHLVAAALCHGGPAAREAVEAELLAVLTAAAALGEGGKPGEVEGGGGGRAALAAQTVFTLIDQLAGWVTDSRAARVAAARAAAAAAAAAGYRNGGAAALAAAAASSSAAAAAGAGDAADEAAVKALLRAVPRELCARAAAAVGAAARALLFFEEHLRRRHGRAGRNPAAMPQPGGNAVMTDAEVSFAAGLYRRLEARDALAALPRLRPGGPAPADRVALAEQAGDFGDALAAHEAALQAAERAATSSSADPATSSSAVLADAERGRLRCLWGLGHLAAVARDAAALLPARPAARAELCATGAAAAWRLGRWDAAAAFADAAEAEAADDGDAGTAATSAGGARPGVDAPQAGPPEGEGALTLARALSALHVRDRPALHAALAAGRAAALAPLAAAAMEGSYERAHPHLARLHALRDAAAAAEVLMPMLADGAVQAGHNAPNAPAGAALQRLCSELEQRLSLTQASLGVREPLLALRGAALALGGDAAGAGRAALAHAKLSRAAGRLGAAQLAVAAAAAAGLPPLDVALEGARLAWAAGARDRAVSELQAALVAHGGTWRGSFAAAAPAPGDPAPKASTPARATLLLARWAHETGQRQKTEVLELYGLVIAREPRWESGFFHMAKYTDELLTDALRRERAGVAPGAGAAASRAAKLAGGAGAGRGADVPERHTDFLVLTVRNYGLALRHGCKRVFEAMPRLLTLWFDAQSLLAPPLQEPGDAAAAAANAPERRRRDRGIEGELRRTMDALLSDANGKLAPYQWLTALPTLISRLCHADAGTASGVRNLLAELAAAYPGQVLWAMAMVSRSLQSARRNAASEVLSLARRNAATQRDRELFTAFSTLVDQLIKVCRWGTEEPKPGEPKVTPPKSFSLASEFSALKRSLPLPVMLPLQRLLTPLLPPSGLAPPAHDPFPSIPPTIAEMQDTVDVLSSLQRPKKLTLRGSDGCNVSFLAKPKDDLRKDSRMMDFVGVLNRVLARDAASRRRRLYLRSFAVVPLTEDCGLIEWVPHTVGLRILLQEQYTAANLFDRHTSNARIKQTYEEGARAGTSPADILRKVLKDYPPVFHRWFTGAFTEPAAWHASRTAFAHTAAVWSIVGHICGLGDRHGENILVDTRSGDCVHVDFSCLFDKGLELEKPEMVPFRLTQNVVDALGVAGTEGAFGAVCENMLTVLRSHRDALMTVLDTFVHDPLLEWTRGGAAHAASDGAKSRDALAKIRSRLEGVVVGVGAAPSLPLSPAGQARRLIEEAMNHDNLGLMYIWWSPWW